MPKINLMPHCTTWSVRVLSAFALMSLVLLLGRSEALAENCKPVHGRFVNQVLVPPPTCTSLLGVCVSGRAIGVLNGDFFATITSSVPSPNFLETGILFQTAENDLSTADGDLYMLEASAYNADPAGLGDLGDVVTIVGGTGKWAGATGRLRVWGNLAVTVSDVTYDGDVCIP